MVTSIGIWPPWAWRRTVRSNMYLRGARKPSNNWTVLSYLEDSWSLEMEGRGGLDWIQHCRHFGQWDWNTYFHHVLIFVIHVHMFYIFYWYLISVFVNALWMCQAYGGSGNGGAPVVGASSPRGSRRKSRRHICTSWWVTFNRHQFNM